MRWSIGLLIVISLLLVGCAQPYTPPVTPTPSAESPDASTTPAEPPPENQTWISPGKVTVADFYPGARAEYPLTIHNGEDTPCSFEVKYREPDHVATGYVKAPGVVQEWVTIADPAPVLSPKETRDILIWLEMPADADSPAPKWEFWISVKDTTQTGMIQTELCTRWLITMKG